MNESILLELKKIRNHASKLEDEIWGADKELANKRIQEIIFQADEAIKKLEDSSGQLVPVWHHPNKGTIPVHKEDSSGKETGNPSFHEIRAEASKKYKEHWPNADAMSWHIYKRAFHAGTDFIINREEDFYKQWSPQSVPPYKEEVDKEELPYKKEFGEYLEKYYPDAYKNFKLLESNAHT